MEDGKDSQKGQVLIPESAKTENGDSPAEQLADLIPKKNQEEYYEYDALGRATKAKDSAGQTVTYAYSESGNLQEMGYPDETKVTYENDLNDNLIKITDRQGAVTEYQYDALNRMVKTIRPNEIVTDVTYDALDYITKLVTSCAGCEEVLSTYEYTYNDQGYIISEKATESLAGYLYDDKHDGKHEDGKHDSEYPHGNKHDGKHDKDGTNAIRVVTTERTYEYDENWQLTKCTEKEENKGTTTYSYKYDSAGNRTAYEKVSEGETVEKYSYKYNDSNQLISKTEKTDWRPWKHVKTTYEYDEDGNLISESSGKKDTKTYEYTVENHLKAVTTSNEVLMAALYDGDGNRLFTLDYVEDGKKSQKGQVLIPESAKTENGDSPAEQLADLVPKKNQEEYYSITQYVNDINRENTEVLMELKTDGTANAAYTYGYSRNSRDTSDGASYYLYDGRGSVSSLASADGVTTNSYQYDPYGNTIFGTPVSINYYGYNGESTNTNTGYQYLRARYYNPANGNFTTEDTNTGTTENPLTRNRYGYVNNNPLNYIDPTGNSLWSRIKKGASNLFKKAQKAITNFGKNVARSVGNLFNKAVSTVGNIAKSVAKGVSSAARAAVGVITNPKKAINSGLNLLQKTAKTVASAASNAAANIASLARQRYKAARGFFSSFNSYVSYRTQQIKMTIQNVLCATAAVAYVSGKITWERTKLNLQNKFDLPFDINIEYTGELKDLAQLGIGIAGTLGGAAIALLGGGGTVASGGAAAGATVPIAWEGVAIAGTGLVTVGSALGNMFNVSISKTDSGNINSSGGDSDSKKNKIPDNDSTTGHIFRDAEGHIPDTPENRALLEDVANDPTNFRGTDKYGNEWYTKIQNDGSQVWVESRNGNIFEGGVNNTPKQWNPETGLKKP